MTDMISTFQWKPRGGVDMEWIKTSRKHEKQMVIWRCLDRAHNTRSKL